MKNLFKFNFIILSLFSTLSSFAAEASDSECILKFNIEKSADRLNPHEVYIGNQFQKKFQSSTKALKLILQLKEGSYCSSATGQLPRCKLDYLPADGYNGKILSFYAIYSGNALIDTIRSKSEAESIVGLLKEARFCK